MSNFTPVDSAGRLPPIALASGAVAAQAYPKAFFVSTSIASRVAWQASEVTVYDPTNTPLTFRSIPGGSLLSSDVYVTNSGVNGLDTGSEAANTWYYLWLISNGTTLAGLLSVSEISPTMPSGYTYKRLVGAYRNNSSSNFIFGYQAGKRMEYNATTPQLYSESTNAGSNIARDVSAIVPKLARLVNFTSVMSSTYSVASMAYVSARIGIYNGGTGNLAHVFFDHQFYNTAGTYIQAAGETWAQIELGGQVYTYHASLGANRTAYLCSISISGYELTEI